VIDCIRVCSDKKDAVVLDFFAGSGTTGQAVMEMNREDDGSRQFILCTNNENNIAQEVTYRRLKNVIEGYAGGVGIPANLRYFRTDFVHKGNSDDQTRAVLVQRSAELISVREGTYEPIEDNLAFKIFRRDSKVTALLLDESHIEDFKEALRAFDKSVRLSIYVFSLSNDMFESDFLDLELDFTLCPVPEGILAAYKKVFNEVNLTAGGQDD
jgi:adenine-specific DNA-methyltransferase